MKNYAHIKDSTQRHIAMLMDHLTHLEDLAASSFYCSDLQAEIAKTKSELASVTGVTLIEDWD